MDRIQTRVFELLKEFDALCRENGISYCLNGETLFYGLSTGSIGPNPCGAFVIMTGDNCRKLIAAFDEKKPADREIEYWGNSPDYPDYTLRYVASDTTSFNIIDYLNYKSHGLFIEVSILRGKSRGRENRMNNAIERGIMLNARNEATGMSEKSGRKAILSDGIYKARSIFGGKTALKKKTFDYFSSECAKPAPNGKGISGTYLFYYRGKLIKDVSQNYFDNLSTCEIEEVAFPAPRSPRAFLRKVFGGKYKYTAAQGDWYDDNHQYSTFSIVDADTPYAEAFSCMDLSKEDFEKIYKAKMRIDSINAENKANNKIAREDWATVQQTGARFRMWKKYMPMKKEILELSAAGEYKKLKEIFEEYTNELAGVGMKRSFSFDNEIFDAYIDMLEHLGKFGEADRLLRYLPKSHLDDIEFDIGEIESK